MKNAIFTYCNFQIDPRIKLYQHGVINKFVQGTGIAFHPLEYKGKDGDMFPDDAIEFGINSLFYEQNYDAVLILDIDCIPLNTRALQHTFNKANQGTLIGNIQRSHYLENGEHLFIGSSCLALSKNTYERLGKPSPKPNSRSDICEEWMYLAEEKSIPTEFYVPQSYEASPYLVENWALKDGFNPYGIGTTFMSQDGEAKFYHLFESRTNLNVERFITKCQSVLA